MQKFLLLLFFVCAVSFTVFAQKTWTGSASESWTEASNWLPAGIPSATDNIVIPTGTPNSPVVLAGAGVSF